MTQTKPDMNKMFNEIDTDESGKIDQKEFCYYFKNYFGLKEEDETEINILNIIFNRRNPN